MSSRPAAPRRTNLLSALDPRSLRWKIAGLAAAASCAVAVSVGVLVHTTTYEWSLNTGRTEALQAVIRAASGTGEQDTPDAVIEDPATLPPELLRQVTPRKPVTWYDDTKPDEPWMWAAVRTGGRVLAVKIDMGAERRSLQALDRHIVMATLAVLAIVVPLAALAAELPNRRLRRVAGTARRIAGGDLDARTGADGRPRDEISEISAAVDSMASALQERLLVLTSSGGLGQGCWCVAWRMPSGEFSRADDARRQEVMRDLLHRDPPPGLLAYSGDVPVGWCNVGPRTAMERLVRSKTIPAVDDVPVWSVVCFVVRTDHRRKGIAEALLRGAVDFAREHGAPAVEAYPIENHGRRVSTTAAYVGTAAMFERAGFRRIAPTSAKSAGLPRVVMRLDLQEATP